MANNQFLTISDVYNPLEVEQRIQSINQAKMQNRISAMKMREVFQDQQRRDKWQAMANDPRGVFNPVSGQFSAPSSTAGMGAPMPVTQTASQPGATPSPTPTPTPPPVVQMTDEDRAAVRGQKKLAAMSQNVAPLINQAKNDPAVRQRINKMAETVNNDPDHQAFVKRSGFDEMNYSMDQDTGEGKYVLAKNWSADELQQYADNAPNGQVLAPLAKHPGKYKIEFNDAGAVTGYYTYSKEEADDLSKYTTSQWIDKSLHDPDPKERQRAREVLKGLGDYEAETYATKYGATMTDEDYRFAAEQYLKTGKMPPMGRSAYVRAQIMRQARMMAQESGTTVDALVAKQAGIGALQGSLKNVQKQENMMNSFVRNLDSQNERLKEFLGVIQRTDARLLNVPIRNFKKRIQGSANEAILDMYLTEISSEVGKLATGSSASVAELSASAREKWEEIHDPNLSVGELFKLLSETQEAAHLRMRSVREEKQSMLRQIEGGVQLQQPVNQLPSGNDPLGLR